MKIVILFGIIAITFGYTQPPDTIWTKTYGGAANDVGNSIKQTSDGGYIIAGYTESFGAGGKDVWLIKTDANGDAVWTRTYGGADDDWAEDIQLTTDGGYIIAANSMSYGAGEGDIWLIKINSQGDTMWTKLHGSSYMGRNEQSLAVQQTSDGGYIIAGRFAFMQWNPLMLKTDANGDTAWIDSIWNDWGWCASVCQTIDDNYIIAGTCLTGVNFMSYPLLINMDADGDTVWCRIYGIGFVFAGWFASVKETADSGYIACGKWWRLGDLETQLLCIVRTDFHGDTLWTKDYGDSLFQRSGNSLHLTDDNGYILTGECGNDIYDHPDLFLFKIDENGDSLWCLVYGELGYADRGNEVLQTDGGGYIVVGSTESYGAGGSDVWIIKTEPDVGVVESAFFVVSPKGITTTIFTGPLLLPEGKSCKVFDITGRVVTPKHVKPGIYFIEVDGKIAQKVVKVR